MSGFNNNVFWRKLLLTAVCPLLVIGILIGVLSYRRAEQAAQESGKNSLSDAVNRDDFSLTVQVRRINGMLQTISNAIPADTGGEALRDGPFSTLCANLIAPFQEIRALTVLRDGQVAYSTSADLAQDAETLRFLYGDAARFPGKANWLALTGIKPAEASAILIYRTAGGAEGASGDVLLLDLDARTMCGSLLAKQKILKHQTTFLLDGDERLIYSDNAVSDEVLEGALRQYHAGKRSFTFEANGGVYYCFAQDNGMTGWMTFSVIGEQHLFPGAVSLRRYIYMLVAVCVLLASLLLLVMSRLITQPLTKLNAAMKRVQDGDFDVQVDNRRKDEIGELTGSFNYMVEQLRELVNRVYREELAQKSAELEALQAQINPHFLYNTLDSINWMLIDRDEMDISAIVVALGKLMQYSMNTEAAFVPLREEYDNARDYLMIQQNRLEDRLSYRLELDEELESFYVPKLILQPMIENSIHHGMNRFVEHCEIEVRADRRGGRICVTVHDNGAGMDEETLAACRRLLAQSGEGQKSIGIRNVARRLQLHFNGQCSFEVDSAVGEGTTFRLLLPIVTGT